MGVAKVGITGFGAYIPRLRLDRRSIAAAHAWMAPGLKGAAKGSRAFCSWDEDSITMAVEAVRDCVAPGNRAGVSALTLASTTLPYADLLNSGVVAGALGLPSHAAVQDVGGSQRCGTSALIAALKAAPEQGDHVVVASERPRAKAASMAEMTSGAGAAAFSTGRGQPIAVLRGASHLNAAFVDHFRPTGAAHDYVWEERWIRDEGHAKLIPQAVRAALAEAGLSLDQIQHLIFASPLKGAAGGLARSLKYQGAVADGLDDGCGYAGAAHPLLQLAHVLEQAGAGENILLIGFGSGVDVAVLETTAHLVDRRPSRGVKGSLSTAVPTSDHMRLLSYYGEIDLEWGMRAEKTGKAALTTVYREADQLSAFVAGRCTCCGTVQFPQLAYCVNTGCVAPSSSFEDFPLSEEAARIMTFTDDWLSYHPAPPLRVGFVQFDNGARLLMEIVDAGAEGISIGDPVDMVFRIKEPDKLRGLNRYFWKAIPKIDQEDKG